MFKMRILQSLYNLSDDQTRFQVRDRLSFQSCLGLSTEETVPDTKTQQPYREQLAHHGLINKLPKRFNEQLRQSALIPIGGQMVEASLVSMPENGEKRDENKQIKAHMTPDGRGEQPGKKRKRDGDARWASKHGKRHCGYKSHINIAEAQKLITRYAVANTSAHDGEIFDESFDDEDSSCSVCADSAYRSEARKEKLRQEGYTSRIHREGSGRRTLNEQEQETNHRHSRIRASVEHVFGGQRTCRGQHSGPHQGKIAGNGGAGSITCKGWGWGSCSGHHRPAAWTRHAQIGRMAESGE